MKLITELIEFALQRNLLTEEQKHQIQDNGFYTFFHPRNEDDDDDDYWEIERRIDERLEEERLERLEEECERLYYSEFYHPKKRFGRRHGGGSRKAHRTAPVTALDFQDLEMRLVEGFKNWEKELEPVRHVASFLANHVVSTHGHDLSTWRHAANWLYEISEKRLSEAMTKLSSQQMMKLVELCSPLPWSKLRELLAEPIYQCKGECVAPYKELIQGKTKSLSEVAQNMIQNDAFAQIYRLVIGWNKIC